MPKFGFKIYFESPNHCYSLNLLVDFVHINTEKCLATSELSALAVLIIKFFLKQSIVSKILGFVYRHNQKKRQMCHGLSKFLEPNLDKKKAISDTMIGRCPCKLHSTWKRNKRF